MQTKVFDMAGKQVGEIELSDAIFGIEPNEAVVHDVVKNHLANCRQGTQSSLTRAEVSGGGIKPWRQKGTGRARQGSIRAPQWIKGGVVFAPKSRDFSKKMNAKAKTGALLSAVSKKLADGELLIVDELKSEGKTKEMAAFVKAMNLNKSALLVMSEKDELVIRATNNLPRVSTMNVDLLNTYDVVANAKVVMTKAAAEKFQEVYA